LPRPKVNILLSFPYFTDYCRDVLSREDPAGFRLMVDSGAFTAWNRGKQVDMDEYVAFIRSLPSEWETSAIQLDVIGDPVATLANFQRMCDMSLDTIPVFTRGAPLEHRDAMYERAPLVAVGGLVGNAKYLPYLRHFMNTNDGRAVHWLGYTNVSDMKKYRPASVDSSAIAGAQRYGAINYYAGNGRSLTIQRHAFANPGKLDVDLPKYRRISRRDECIAALRRLRFTTGEIARLGLAESWNGDVARTPDAPRRPDTTGTGFASFVNFVNGIAHGIEVERNIGIRVYQALAAVEHLRAVFASRDFLVERGLYGWAIQQEALA
jgi:hypothetical protein